MVGMYDDRPITARENEVLNLVIKGTPNKAIGVNLGITEQTVKNHVRNIMAKKGVHNRLELIIMVIGERVHEII